MSGVGWVEGALCGGKSPQGYGCLQVGGPFHSGRAYLLRGALVA